MQRVTNPIFWKAIRRQDIQRRIDEEKQIALEQDRIRRQQQQQQQQQQQHKEIEQRRTVQRVQQPSQSTENSYTEESPQSSGGSPQDRPTTLPLQGRYAKL